MPASVLRNARRLFYFPPLKKAVHLQWKLEVDML
jgi:hypothetical protein|uniref:Uncharacterized protein n=1 Tax=Siphoviridae sp. ctzto35 TaxID=2826533 RepID=A0A8S5MJ43_9CAUD|nr:MAG TPA: hypothetical protein [Siphoviridae sp. ctzto35]